MKYKDQGFYLLQETHSSLQYENEWLEQWESKILFSHGESNAHGVAILISKQLDVKINEVKRDINGRFIPINCTISENKYIIVNIYTPTINNKQEQVTFVNYVLEMLQPYLGEIIIIGGDLNIDLDKSQKETLPTNSGYSRQLSLMIQTFDLIDIWRLKYSDTVRYTRREKTCYGFKQSRLHYILLHVI